MPATVVDVVDGDTIDVVAYPWPGVTMSARVRILGIDTPETYRPGCERERDLGRLATAYVRSSVGEQIWLTEVQDEPDKFGRLLARVLTKDGIDIGRELMRQGLATVWPPPEEWDWCE
jgi:endonuclease YncB( thermonuclease family)